MKDLILIINLGLSSAKSIAFNYKGEKVCMASKPVTTKLNDNFVEQDPEEWWSAVSHVIKEITEKDDAGQRIRYISFTSSSSCLVTLDHDYKPACNAIMVSDKRARNEAIELSAEFSDMFGGNTILSLPTYMIPKILWIKKNMPEIFAKSRKFLSPNDFLFHRITGRFLTDPLNAEKFYYNVSEKRYPSRICEFLGIDESFFPEVKEIGSEAGPILEKMKKELSLPNAIPVITTYDALCAFLGSGSLIEGSASLTGGTVLSLRAFSSGGMAKPSGQVLLQKFHPYPIGAIGCSNNIGGSLLEWLRECFYADAEQQTVYSRIENDARRSSVGANGLIFVPYLLGERSPFYDPDARGIFFGLERFHSPSDISRSVYESIGFMALQMINQIEDSGVPVRELKVSGGLFRNEFISKIVADITGRPVDIIEDPETTSFGSFLLIMKKIASLGNEEICSMVRIKKTYEPEKEANKYYARIYPLFKKIYEDNIENFKLRKMIFSSSWNSGGYFLQNL
jgi:sugar (pentulose or hexulose) kinase